MRGFRALKFYKLIEKPDIVFLVNRNVIFLLQKINTIMFSKCKIVLTKVIVLQGG